MNTEDTRGARIGLGLGLPAVAGLLWIVPFLVVREDLPSQLASHFDIQGTPDAAMSATGMLTATGILVAVGVVMCLLLAFLRRPWPRGVASIVGFLGGLVSGLGAGLMAMTAITQRGLTGWQQARVSWPFLVGMIGVAMLGGAVAARLAADLPQRQDQPQPGQPPAMDLAASEQAVWTTSLHSRLLGAWGAAAIVFSVVIAIGTFWWIAVSGLVTGVGLLCLSTLHVRADCSGLHVRYGLLPWPRTDVNVTRMATATVIDVEPMKWGGWGYRGSLALMNQAAVVHRAGPGIRLDLQDGKVFVVTVDQPAAGVALLNAEIARQGG